VDAKPPARAMAYGAWRQTEMHTLGGMRRSQDHMDAARTEYEHLVALEHKLQKKWSPTKKADATVRQGRFAGSPKKSKKGSRRPSTAISMRRTLADHVLTPAQTRKSLHSLVEGGIDMWGSKRVPVSPKAEPWEEEAEWADMDQSTPQIPSDTELRSPSPPKQMAPRPVTPQQASGSEQGPRPSADPYGEFTRHVVSTIIRYRIYLDEDLDGLMEAAMNDFGHLERRRLKNIVVDIRRQLREEPRLGSPQVVDAESPETSPKADPGGFDMGDPYERFAGQLVQKIIGERIFQDEELIQLFESEFESNCQELDRRKCLDIVSNIKKELSLCSSVMTASKSL